MQIYNFIAHILHFYGKLKDSNANRNVPDLNLKQSLYWIAVTAEVRMNGCENNCGMRPRKREPPSETQHRSRVFSERYDGFETGTNGKWIPPIYSQ